MPKMRRREFLKATSALVAGALAAPAIRPAMAQGGAIRIGVLTDQSGLYADLSGPGSVVAARLAVEDFGGRVGSTPVEIVAADHQNRPDVASALARQWFDHGVSAVADIVTSSVALAVAEIAREKNRVALVSGAASADLTGRACSPNTVHWTYDNWALANGTARAVVQAGGRSWYFLTVDYAFGHDLEAQVAAVVRAAGGEVLGAVRHPLNVADLSSFLLQAQRSRAQIIGLANAGGDTINAIKQAAEFGLMRRGQKLAGLLVFITDVHALGLEVAQGLQFTESFYWDLNDATRAWSARFAARHGGRKPSMIQAGVYASVMHYLKALREVGSANDGLRAVEAMKATPTEDPCFGRGTIRVDGRKLHDMYLFEAKTPSESRGPWDYYKLVRTIPAAEAFRPLGACQLAR
jgi:branched-chain amino acid transport system substrate-binding protein